MCFDEGKGYGIKTETAENSHTDIISLPMFLSAEIPAKTVYKLGYSDFVGIVLLQSV